MYAFAYVFDCASFMRNNLKVKNRNISLQSFTNSKSLFKVVTKFSNTDEKLLVIDIQCVKKYSIIGIKNIGFARTKNKPADPFTKMKQIKLCKRLFLKTNKALKGNNGYTVIIRLMIPVFLKRRDC